MELPLDYATLRVIWWALVGVLLIGFALTDGFDMGVGALLPFVAKTDMSGWSDFGSGQTVPLV